MSAWSGEILDRIKQRGHITLAHRSDNPPLSYTIAGQAQPLGFSVDLCLRLVESLKTTLKLKALHTDYLLVNSESRFDSIAQKQADLECGATTDNPERRKRFAFAYPHYIAGARLLVRQASPYKELNDLQGKRVVATAGTTSLKDLKRWNEERTLRLHIMEPANDHDAMALIRNNQAEAFVMDDIQLLGLMALEADPTQFRITGKPLTLEPLSIMMNKDDLELQKLLNKELAALMRSGEVRQIYDKWFKQPIPPNGANLNVPPNPMIRAMWSNPGDFVLQ